MTPGTQLGSYEILSPLGKGGMGEVWRALDSKLGREVAIKTLPEEFAKDEERLARFEREAKLLASLNHPNIAAIYGLEEDNGTRFLVLELVEGDTLADRLKRGAIPVEESLKLALQIAEALEAAHGKGVIHRDLKPANIKVTPDGKVKVLDFGLAKAFAGDGSGANLSQSPTLSMAATQQGTILGTAAYMSPEQASGLEVDKRSDIWAFGVVLFELLAGRGLFTGETAPHILASVLKTDPDWNSLPPNLHSRLRLLLERCLEKESKDRYGDISDARVDIQKVLSDPDGVIVQPVADITQGPPKPMLRWIAVTAVVSVVVAGLAGWYLKPSEPRPAIRFYHVLPEGQAFTGVGRPMLAVSPDGSEFLYNTNEGLYLRSMDELYARLVTEENLRNPFFSSDGQWVGYWSFADSQLKKIAVTGGAAVALCAATNPYGASWGLDHTIVFGQPEGIMRVSANGGTPELLVATEQGEQVHGPQILPDEKSVLFTLTSATGQTRWDEAEVVVQSLETGERKVLVEVGSDGRYVPTGHLIYAFEDVLFAVPFDLASLEVTGGPVPIVEGVARANANQTGTGHFSFSTDGSLVHAVGGVGTSVNRILALVDQSGVAEPLKVPPAPYLSPRLSPDGTQLAVQTLGDDGQSVVWVYDLSGDTAIRRLTQEGNNSRPIWTPDGERLTFASDRDGTTSIWWQPADGSGVAEPLTTAEDGTSHLPESWSPDGNVLSFAVQRGGDTGIWTLSLDGRATPEVFYDLPESVEGGSLFSPDGKWLAYDSQEGGVVRQVYVQPFPATGAKHQITQQRNVFPVWSPDGKELFYLRPPGGSLAPRIMGVAVSTDGAFRWGNEQPHPIQGFVAGFTSRDYDFTPDDQRLLMVFPAERMETDDPARPQINIVLNWFEELKERVPVP